MTVRGDSKLVVNQVNGVWACNFAHLREARGRCQKLIERLERGDEVELEWVPREQNTEADALSVAAYETHTGRSFPERKRRT